MKHLFPVSLLSLALLTLVQGCNCGKPPDVPDAGLCAASSPCGACPSGCSQADTCNPATGWQCACTCTVTAATLCDEYAKRACDFFIRCHAEASLFFDPTEGRAPTPPTPSGNQVASSERARCEAAIATSQSCFQVQESFKANRTRFDPVAYSACQAALYPGDRCIRDLNLLQELCLKTSFVRANAPVGQTCSSDRECLEGWCDVPTSASCGLCKAYVALSGTCTRDAQCDPASQYCARNNQSTGTCAPFRADGQSCNLTEFTSCGPDRQCAITGIIAIAGKCQQGLAEGASCIQGKYACKRSNRALPELLCAPQRTGGSNACVKLQSLAGGPCGNGELIIPDPNDPNGGLRGPLCPDAQYCANNVCTPRKSSGAPCAADLECGDGLRCAGTAPALTCQPYTDTAASCTTTAQCKNLLACGTSSTCAPDTALNGEACPSGVSCVAGTCNTPGAAPTCVAFKSTGAACGGNSECRSSTCAATCQQACWQAP